MRIAHNCIDREHLIQRTQLGYYLALFLPIQSTLLNAHTPTLTAYPETSISPLDPCSLLDSSDALKHGRARRGVHSQALENGGNPR